MSDPVARRSDLARLRDELGGEFRAANDQLRDELRGEFRAANDQLRDELRGEIRGANDQLRDELRGDMRAMEQRMLWEIGHAISAGVDQTAKMIAAVDDKYRDLPARVAALEARDERE